MEILIVSPKILLFLTYCGNTFQPYGFDVGQSERGSVLKGLDLGVEGMRVGGQVRSVPLPDFLISFEAIS